MRVTKKIKEEQIRILEQTYLGAKPALKFRNPFELLIAVILSAQCTDKRVNVTTARLFAKAPTPAAIVALGLPQLEEEIRDCGLFRNKAKNIMATCVTLCEQYGGEVPEDYDSRFIARPSPSIRMFSVSPTGCTSRWGKRRSPLRRDCSAPSRKRNGRMRITGSYGTDGASARRAGRSAIRARSRTCVPAPVTRSERHHSSCLYPLPPAGG